MLMQAYANARGVRLVGDMPIYVGGHSADVWASRHLFELTGGAFLAGIGLWKGRHSCSRCAAPTFLASLLS